MTGDGKKILMCSENTKGLWIVVLFCFFAALVSFMIARNCPINDFREAQVASTSEIFAKEGIHLFYPKLNVMGDPGYFVLEFPAYQALAGLLWNIFGWGELWGKILSHLFWSLAAVYLYILCLLFADRRLSLVTVFLFLFSPIALLNANAVGLESFSVFLSIAFLYYGARWILNKRPVFFIVTLLISVLGFLVKLPNIAPLYLALIFLKIDKEKTGWKTFVSPDILLWGAVSLIPAILWQRHADAVNSAYPASAWYTNSQLRDWYFGTIWQKLNPKFFMINFSKALENALGSFPAGVFILIGLFSAKKYRFFLGYLLSYVAAYFVFTNLHYTHLHYMIPFLAPQVFFAAIGILACWDGLRFPEVKIGHRQLKSGFLRAILVFFGAVGVMCWNSLYLDMRGFIYNDYDVAEQAQLVREYVPADARVVMYWASGGSRGTWNPVLMYLSHRRGVTVYLDDLEASELHSLLKQTGADYLVLAGESIRYIYVGGKQSNRTFKDKVYSKEFSLDNFKLDLPSSVEQKLSILKPVYKSDRLRIYTL